MTPGGTFLLGAALLACGSLIGLYLALVTSPLLFIIGGAGLLTGLLYSAPPVFLAGRGLGELTVGLDFGLLVVLGAFVVQTGALGPAPAIASLPLSFLIAAILYMNEFPDLEADRATGKKTLVVRLGRRRAITGFYVIIFGAYLSLVIGVVLGFLAAASLLALLSAPLAVRAAMVLRAQQGAGPGLVPGIKSLILAHLSCALLLAGGGVIGA
jgi:1,4-dihydroxy-2-naphthoate octaprenyltransferase